MPSNLKKYHLTQPQRTRTNSMKTYNNNNNIITKLKTITKTQQ